MIARSIATLPWHAIAIVFRDDRHAVDRNPFLIGRDEGLDLVIDSPAVSRRHARLCFDGDEWKIEDLDSRNGVVLNGLRVRGRAPLRAGDVVMLADSVLAVVPAKSSELDWPAQNLAYLSSGAAAEDTSPVDGFLVFTTHVDHALLSGEILEAERLFAVHLGRPAERAAARGKLEPAMARTLSLLALRLGEATGSAVWLDFVLRLYAASGSVIPLPVVSGMHSLAHRLGGVDRSALRQYTAQLARSRPLVLEERNAVDRLHALPASRFPTLPEDSSEWPESRRILAQQNVETDPDAPPISKQRRTR
jgi:pSer/pThr/pTyr-binding forkhead associated (FHA) protein